MAYTPKVWTDGEVIHIVNSGPHKDKDTYVKDSLVQSSPNPPDDAMRRMTSKDVIEALESGKSLMDIVRTNPALVKFSKLIWTNIPVHWKHVTMTAPPPIQRLLSSAIGVLKSSTKMIKLSTRQIIRPGWPGFIIYVFTLLTAPMTNTPPPIISR